MSTSPELDEGLRVITASPTKFAKALLGITPFPYQMKILEDPSNRIVVCSGRQVGKSFIMAVRALWFAITHPDTSTLIVSATQRQSMFMFDKILDHLDGSVFLSDCIVRRTRTQLKFTNGSSIIALPSGRHGRSLRGSSANFIICDEAAFVPSDVIMDVMMPMLATTQGTMIMISTPFDKSHVFYRAFNSPEWSRYHFKTSDNPLVTKEFLKQQLDLMGDRSFRQEFLAEFVDDERTYFPMDLIRLCVHACESTDCHYCSVTSGRAQPSGELYAGYDPGGMTDPAALVVVKKLPASKSEKPAFRVALMKTFYASGEKKEAASSDVYTKFTVEISDLHKKLHFRKLLVDSTGIGRPILEHCKELGLPAEGMTLVGRLHEEIFSNLKILLEKKEIELPDSLELLSSLNCIVATRNRIGRYIFDHPNGTHNDLAFALALAVWQAGKGSGTVVLMKRDENKVLNWREAFGANL